MPLDWSSGGLATGLACYRNREFFEAHEHWEEVWNGLVDPEKLFVQALIQVTVAMHHYQHANRAGALSLLQRALRKLDKYPERFGGIDVGRLREDVRSWLVGLEAEEASPGASPSINLVFRS
jgi:predicted metal-dependent hydrolase